MKARVLLCGLVALIVPVSQAAAQDGAPTRVRAGLGVDFTPEYPGADGNAIGPMFDFSLARDGEQFSFEAPDDSFDIGLISAGGFAAGPVLNLERSRKESDVGAPVGKVSTTVEAGVFAQFRASESFRIRGEVRRGIGGHDGFVGSLGADYILRDADNYTISAGPRLMLSDKEYQRAYFGVTPPVALATGLPVYSPGGGIHAVAATSGIYYSFTPVWGMFGYARYERLVGDAKRSPIVREFGSANQYSAGIGLTYTFSLAR
jgi:MipA family protein